MPELPEVNTIKNQLNQVMPLEVKSLSTSEFIDSISHTPLKGISKNVITEVQRKGKMLIFKFKNGYSLLSHLGMSGGWRISEKKIVAKHTHFQIEGLSDGKKIYLAYVDPRRFGHMYYLDELSTQKKLNELGPDLLSRQFDIPYLTMAIKKYPERKIKVTLLDQKLFAGSGNYIANEICAHAGIRPTRLCKNIKKDEFLKIFKGVMKVIKDTSESGGTTFAGGYADTTGSKGGGVNHLVVFYQKTCQLCKKTPVKKILLAQRGTYYCSHCQK